MQRDHLSDRAFGRRRREVMVQWVRGSNRRTSTLLKHAVKAEFDIGRPVYQRRAFAIRSAQVDGLRPVVRRMYAQTQADLRDRGITEALLYRGLKSPAVVGDVLESWTDNLSVAQGFGSYDILVETIPAARIFMYYLGAGWITGPFGQQFEFLVLSEAPR